MWVYKYLKRGYKEGRAKIFSVVPGDRGSGQKLKQEIPPENELTIFVYGGSVWAERLEKMISRGVLWFLWLFLSLCYERQQSFTLLCY